MTCSQDITAVDYTGDPANAGPRDADQSGSNWLVITGLHGLFTCGYWAFGGNFGFCSSQGHMATKEASYIYGPEHI